MAWKIALGVLLVLVILVLWCCLKTGSNYDDMAGYDDKEDTK